MGGTQRVTKFVKYLPQFGWRPYVITVKDVAYYAKDPTLLEGMTAVKIYRTGSFDPQRLINKFSFRKTEENVNYTTPTSRQWQIVNKLVAWFLVPDSKLLWLPFVILKAVKLIRNEKIDYLLSTSPPHSVHLAGLLLKWITGIPWAADFRDGWSGGNFQYEPTRLHKWINHTLEKRVLIKADKVIGVSRGLVENFKEQVPQQKDKFAVITNGFDFEDISSTEDYPPNEKFTVTFCGAITSISPITGFLESLGKLIKTHQDLRKDMSVKFVGVDLEGKAKETVRKLELQGIVTFTGYVSHRRALSEILRADLLLYPIAPWATRDFIPGKTFEYLASGKPVLAIGAEIEGTEILKNTTRLVHVQHNDLNELERAILKFYRMFKEKSLTIPHRKDIFNFEMRKLTEKLAKFLDN
jgi:glycosyltransferase involved in cell wall biosynthesis